MVIDVEARAKRLGIALGDYKDGSAGLSRMIVTYRGKETEDRFKSAIKSLPKKQMVALIRWNRFDIQFPDDFDWNGVKR